MKRLLAAALVAGGMLAGTVSTAHAVVVQFSSEWGPVTFTYDETTPPDPCCGLVTPLYFTGMLTIGDTTWTGYSDIFPPFGTTSARLKFTAGLAGDTSPPTLDDFDFSSIPDDAIDPQFAVLPPPGVPGGPFPEMQVLFHLSTIDSALPQSAGQFRNASITSSLIYTAVYSYVVGPSGGIEEGLLARGSTSIDTGFNGTISPVPLPAGAWLLLSALGGLGGFAGWRRRKAAAA